jgi:hypothetical protein
MVRLKKSWVSKPAVGIDRQPWRGGVVWAKHGLMQESLKFAATTSGGSSACWYLSVQWRIFCLLIFECTVADLLLAGIWVYSGGSSACWYFSVQWLIFCLLIFKCTVPYLLLADICVYSGGSSVCWYLSVQWRIFCLLVFKCTVADLLADICVYSGGSSAC